MVFHVRPVVLGSGGTLLVTYVKWLQIALVWLRRFIITLLIPVTTAPTDAQPAKTLLSATPVPRGTGKIQTPPSVP